MFDYVTACKVLTTCKHVGVTWSYVAENDVFVVDWIDSEAEQYTGEDIIVHNDVVRGYPIGAGSWIWAEIRSDVR